MKKNRLALLIGLCVVLILSFSAVGWAEPTQVLVARDSSGFLHKKTCNGTSCSGWTAITGRFRSQPLVTWDNDYAKYYVYGTDYANNIWRASFSRTGTFYNDWVAIGGSSPNPIGGTGGGIANNFNYSSTTLDYSIGYTMVNVSTRTMTIPDDGYIKVTGSGLVKFTSSVSTSKNVWCTIYLVDTSGGTSTYYQTAELNYIPSGDTCIPFSYTRIFYSSGGSKTYYLTAEEGGSAAVGTKTYIHNPVLTIEYFPYKY